MYGIELTDYANSLLQHNSP